MKEALNTKKTKNILFTLLESIVVAGLIFGILMFLYKKVNQDTEQQSIGTEETKEDTKDPESRKYYMEINRAKNIAVVYEHLSGNHQDGDVFKVFSCSVGVNVKDGEYKAKKDYEWIKTGKFWHQYNTKLGEDVRICSANYTDRYPDTLVRKSYYHVGRRIKGNMIFMYASDAAWISENCRKFTFVKIIQNKTTEVVSVQPTERQTLHRYCRWDPSDPSKDNPYNKLKPGEITGGSRIVYIQRGYPVQYLRNLLALDEYGNDISSKLRYNKFKTKKVGKHTVRYTYTSSEGIKYEWSQKFRVIDTECPKVTCSRRVFDYYVISQAKEDMNKESNVKEIEAMVRPYVSCNEDDCTIIVNTVKAGEMAVGEHPVIITATDMSGNVGADQVIVNVKLKKPHEQTLRNSHTSKSSKK